MTAHLKGGAVLTRLAYVTEKYGEEGRERVLEQIDPEFRRRIERGLLKSEWFQLRGFQQIVATTDSTFGDGDWRVARDMGRYSAEANLTSLYKAFYKVGTPKFIMSRAATVWKAQHDHGKLGSEQLSRRAFRISLTEHPELDAALTHSIIGWSLRAIELSGGQLARHELEEEVFDGIDRRVSWFLRWV